MSSRKIPIIIGIVIIILIPLLIITSMNNLKRKASEQNTNNTEFFVLEVRGSTLFICDENNNVGLCTVGYENVDIFDENNKKIVGHIFETQQLIKINYKQILESYPAQLGGVGKITITKDKGTVVGYEKAKKVYDDFLKNVSQ